MIIAGISELKTILLIYYNAIVNSKYGTPDEFDVTNQRMSFVHFLFLPPSLIKDKKYSKKNDAQIK